MWLGRGAQKSQIRLISRHPKKTQTKNIKNSTIGHLCVDTEFNAVLCCAGHMRFMEGQINRQTDEKTLYQKRLSKHPKECLAIARY